MTTLLADTAYLTASPYGVWGVIMVVFLLVMVCYNAWQDDREERRRGYYVLAAAFVLGLLVLLALHFWQVAPQELFRTIYRRFGIRHRHISYNLFFFLSLGWIAASWGIGCAVDRFIRSRQEDEEVDEEDDA